MNSFDLIIGAVIAVALIFIAINIFNPLLPQEDILQKLNNSIKLAQTNDFLGKTILVSSNNIENDFLLSNTSFDLEKMSVAIECTDGDRCCPINEECNKIEWDFEFAKFKNQTSIDFFVRCIYDKLSICRIYIGKKPAQAEIQKIELVEINGTKAVIQTKVTNTGRHSLTIGKIELTLDKNTNGNWVDTKEVFDSQEINLLLPSQEHNFIFEIDLPTMGEYKTNFKFSGNNSGYDINFITFEITQNTQCSGTANTQTFLENGKYKEYHYCSGCNFAYECLAKWQELDPTNDWQLYTKEASFFEREALPEELFTQEECSTFELNNNLQCNYGNYCPDSEYPIIAPNSDGICCCHEK